MQAYTWESGTGNHILWSVDDGTTETPLMKLDTSGNLHLNGTSNPDAF
ncbi:hypothetical protein [Haladaptatus sp. NG-SE-30]